MSVWLTYSLNDFLLFSPQTYFRLFELYNRAIWPAQILALGAGVAILLLLRRPGVPSGRAIAGILAACWLWVAWAYLHRRYATINWAADHAAIAFAAQALLLLVASFGRPIFQVGADVPSLAGLCLLLFAFVLQPLLGPLLGRSWVQVELFGLTPDPTAVATLGIVLLSVQRRHLWLLVVPLLWCAASTATLWAMEATEAWVTMAAGIVAATAAVGRLSRRGRVATPSSSAPAPDA